MDHHIDMVRRSLKSERRERTMADREEANRPITLKSAATTSMMR
jgi:hypothetical protein